MSDDRVALESTVRQLKVIRSDTFTKEEQERMAQATEILKPIITKRAEE